MSANWLAMVIFFAADKVSTTGVVTVLLVLPAPLALLVLVSLLAPLLWLGTADGVDCDCDCGCDFYCDRVPAAEPEALLERVSPALRTVTLLFSSKITGDEFSVTLIFAELVTEIRLLDSPELFWYVF